MFDDLAQASQPRDDEALRKRAIKRLKNRRDFFGHVLLYSMVNTFLTLIWLFADRHGFFWPVFPIVGWGIAVVLNAWDVYRDDEFDDEQIQREIARMRHRA